MENEDNDQPLAFCSHRTVFTDLLRIPRFNFSLQSMIIFMVILVSQLIILLGQIGSVQRAPKNKAQQGSARTKDRIFFACGSRGDEPGCVIAQFRHALSGPQIQIQQFLHTFWGMI
jgi:hypothetical protein